MPAKRNITKTAKPKRVQLTEEEIVTAYMDNLEHPLKAEIEALRIIIKGAHSGIRERIKWNAPSYHTTEDMVTFNHRMTDQVHLIFHHPAIEKIASPLLEGNYAGRRMTYFKDMKAVKANKKELVRIINILVSMISS